MIAGEQTFPDTDKPMKDRVALVIGGSRGIGAATALLLGRSGARVGVNYYQNAATAQAVVSTIEQAGGKALAIQAFLPNCTAHLCQASWVIRDFDDSGKHRLLAGSQRDI